MPFRAATLVESLELTLALAGAWLLWRHVLSPAARAKAPAARLVPWVAPVSEIFIFLVFILGGTFIAGAVASLITKPFGVRGDAATVVTGATAQLGMLAGVALYWSRPERGRPTFASGDQNVFVSGAFTFVACLPVVILTTKLWELLLQAVGLPTEKQDLVSMFRNAESPWVVGVMITLAVGIAPVAEEMVFRAGFFRFLRTRIPRWLALVTPALVFAVLHVNWSTLQGLSSLAPLVVLAVVFSLAYERTGLIGTPIIAHALFNLNTIVLIFAGVGV